MGTTRIKVIDLSGEKQEIKTSRKHAEKLTGVAKLKEKKQPKIKVEEKSEGKPINEITEDKLKAQRESTTEISSVPSKPSAPSVITKQSVSPVVARSHRHLGQKYLKATQLFDKNKPYPAREAIDLLYKTSTTHFDPTVEIHLNVTDKNIRGNVNLPHAVATKKERRYLIFSDKKPITESTEDKLKAQKGSSTKIPSAPSKPSVPSVIKNIIWGNEKTISEIESGKLKPQRDFDAVIAQPKFMPELAKIAKILGPCGLMPNPKNNTVTENVASAFERASSATFEYKSDPSAPLIHTKLGKLSYKPQQLEENLKTLILAIGPTKIKKATIATTMGPGIKVDLSTLN